MAIPKSFWKEEAEEPAHKRIKNALLAAGETPQPKKHKKAKSHKGSKAKSKVHKVMKEFKDKKLHAGSKKGPIIKNRKQAIAVALSEARRKGK